MPGIAGIVDYSSDGESINLAIGKMIDILDHSSPCEQETYRTGKTAISSLSPCKYSVKGLIAEDESTALVFWGSIWDRDDLVKRSNRSCRLPENISTGQLLLNLYNVLGERALYKLNGRFVVAIWKKKEKVLRLICDRYGFCKVFYWAFNDRILFASEYKAIIWHEEFQREVDKEALANFMSLGYNLGDKTFFKNIKLLSHGSVLGFKVHGKMSIERYWDYSFRNGNSALKEVEEFIDEYYTIIREVIERQVKNRSIIGLPLSGGLDSRLLVGILKEIGFRGEIKTFSYGNVDCLDVIYGRRISKKLGYSHKFIPIKDTYLSDNVEKFVWITEGTIDCLNAHMILPHAFIVEENMDAILTGFLGDTIGGEPVIGGIMPYKEIMDEDDFVERIFNNQIDIIRKEELAAYFKKGVYEKIEDVTFNTYRTHYDHLLTRNRYYKSTYAELIGRQRRYTSFNVYAFEALTEVLPPFTDNKFVDFALQIPDILAFTRYVQREMIVRYLSKVASIPWNNTRLPLNASWLRKGVCWRWKRFVRNPLIKSTIGRKYARMNDNYINSAEAVRTGSREFVVSHIRDNPFLAEYFNMDKIIQMLDGHMGRRYNEQRKITAFLTLSMWHKLFVEKNQLNR